MALQPVSPIAGERAGKAFAGALLLLLLLIVRAGPTSAADQNEAFSATVKVDATADSAAAARDLARIDGQRRALAMVIDRLSGGSEPTKLPKLDDKAITDMVESFEVANERMSAVRYLADYTFHFRPSKLRRLVRITDTAAIESGGKASAENAGKNSAESSGKPVVVLPVYRDGSSLALWADPNAWRAAWAQRSSGSGPTHLTLPLGDAGDVAAIDAENAQSGKSDALTSIAERNGGTDAVVAMATARRQGDRVTGLEVSVKRYRAGRLVDTQGKTFDASPEESEGDFLKRTADAVAADIESGPKKNAGSASLAAVVPITGLGEWLEVRNRLASVASIRKVDLLSLSRQEAKIEIKYVGSPDQLKSSLADANLDLGGDAPQWRIQPSSATSSR
jgi:Uncharacterized protein conserved in bacteria (DUF2066)